MSASPDSAAEIFDPKLDVSSMLGGIGNTLADLKSIPTAITSALPGQILCRAQPSLCNLMQHYSVRAEDAWRFSVDACENILSESTDQPWIKFAKAQEWQRQASAGTDAATAHRRVSETEDPCITWVSGELAGLSWASGTSAGHGFDPCRLVCNKRPATRLPERRRFKHAGIADLVQSAGSGGVGGRRRRRRDRHE